MAITNELGQEKLDVIEWAEDIEEFIAQALNPAKVKVVEVIDNREVKVLVADDQLSLAIGKGGQNVRLAAKLTGWKIDVRSQARPDESLEGGIGEAASVTGAIGEEVEKVKDSVAEKEDESPVYPKVYDEEEREDDEETEDNAEESKEGDSDEQEDKEKSD